jgi:hypothetical protein
MADEPEPTLAGLSFSEIHILKQLADQQALHRDGLLTHAINSWKTAHRHERRAAQCGQFAESLRLENEKLKAENAALQDLLARHGHGDPERYG